MHEISLILTVTYGLAFALLFGAITHRFGLSPIVGYLLAGIAVGPHTPGFVADVRLASQLAEIGVILLMFGVGLHFHLDDLWRVRGIAIPGAIGQSAIATLLLVLAARPLGLSIAAGIVLGVAVAVASTVVLVRLLADRGLLDTPAGRAAVGWLVVEDIFTVLVLVLLPALAGKEGAEGAGATGGSLLVTLAIAAGKVAVLGVVILVGGRRLVPLLMNSVARTRSRELFTLAVLVVALGVAAGSAMLFGVSMALGAFLAGMVVGQSEVSHQAAADALPMRDAFAVMFFVSVGMLFDPRTLIDEWRLLLIVLGVILVGKPLSAVAIVVLLGKPLRTALTVAVALAQIGEFSFIVGALALQLGLLTAAASSVLVTAAIVSITLNPLLFRIVEPLERWLRAQRWLRRRSWLRRSFGARIRPEADGGGIPPVVAGTPRRPRAVVVGHGPVGRTLTRLLREFAIDPVVIDLNVDTVRALRQQGMAAIYGDASHRDILEAAHLLEADFALVTLPDPAVSVPVIIAVRTLHPEIRILVRARHLGERVTLEHAGATAVAYEEAEVAVALAELLLRAIGVRQEEIESRTAQVRRELALAVPQLPVGR